MANTAVTSTDTQRAFRTWLISFVVISAVMAAVGLGLAAAETGPALPWIGVTLFVGMGLAAIVGLSKTSSA
jgi:hypothetical protein